MKGKMQNMGSRYRTWGPEVEFRMQRWDIGQEMEYKIQMKDVQGMGCRRGIWDTGHRRWDVEAGHGMQKWDVGCRYGMEVQDMGWRCRTWDAAAPEHHSSAPALHRDPQHPWRWGVRATSREIQTSKEKVIAFQSHTDILQLVPHLGGRSRPFGHICLPDVQGRGTEPLWMGNLPSPLCAGQVGNAALPYHTCSGEKPGWNQGAVGRRDWMGPVQPHRGFSLQ